MITLCLAYLPIMVLLAGRLFSGGGAHQLLEEVCNGRNETAFCRVGSVSVLRTGVPIYTVFLISPISVPL